MKNYVFYFSLLVCECGGMQRGRFSFSKYASK